MLLRALSASTPGPVDQSVSITDETRPRMLPRDSRLGLTLVSSSWCVSCCPPLPLLRPPLAARQSRLGYVDGERDIALPCLTRGGVSDTRRPVALGSWAPVRCLLLALTGRQGGDDDFLSKSHGSRSRGEGLLIPDQVSLSFTNERSFSLRCQLLSRVMTLQSLGCCHGCMSQAGETEMGCHDASPPRRLALTGGVQ